MGSNKHGKNHPSQSRLERSLETVVFMVFWLIFSASLPSNIERFIGCTLTLLGAWLFFTGESDRKPPLIP